MFGELTVCIGGVTTSSWAPLHPYPSVVALGRHCWLKIFAHGHDGAEWALCRPTAEHRAADFIVQLYRHAA